MPVTCPDSTPKCVRAITYDPHIDPAQSEPLELGTRLRPSEEAVGRSGLLSVREEETFRESRLHHLENVVVSPHVAGMTQQTQLIIGVILCAQIDRMHSGSEAMPAAGSHRLRVGGVVR